MTLASSTPLSDTWGMHGDVGAGWMIAMMLVMVLFWAAVILGIVWLVRGPHEGRRGGRRETPSEILDRRFAEGAISLEEYDERRQAIGVAGRRKPSKREASAGPLGPAAG